MQAIEEQQQHQAVVKASFRPTAQRLSEIAAAQADALLAADDEELGQFSE